MDDTTLSFLITLGAAGVFAVCAWATFWIWRARESGWQRLAAHYGAKASSESSPRRWQSIRFMPSRIGYPGMITFRARVEGLYAIPAFPCRFGHEPLLIPWNDIAILAIETYPADRLYDLQMACDTKIRMRVGVAVAQFIRRAADNSQYFTSAPTPRVHTVPAKPRLGYHATVKKNVTPAREPVG